MRRQLSLIVTGVCLSATPAFAQAPELSSDALFSAAFAPTHTPSGVGNLLQSQALADPGMSVPLRGRAPAIAVTKPVRLEMRGLDLDLSSHAGLGSGNWGRSAEAGAELRVGASDKSGLKRLGLDVQDGKSFGDQGRWYMFAAVSGKAVGLNMTRAGQGGDWRSAGWSTDPSSAVIGDGQLGVGWRKAGMQAAFGYVHREIKVRNAPYGADNDVGDSMAAFTLSIKPHK